MQKHISYSTTNSYETRNTLTSDTRRVWLVMHGLGYLSKYFINYFESLAPEENYIIAPQAPSKYYQDKQFKYVGASWLTKEDTQQEIANNLSYLDAVWNLEKEQLKELSVSPKLIILGYSQGVSMATRWLQHAQVACNHLILHSGAIPSELQPEDFDFLPQSTRVTYLYGNNDEYINEARKTEQEIKGKALFGNRLDIHVFDGKHEVNVDFIKEIN